jgi:hypothetical protein
MKFRSGMALAAGAAALCLAFPAAAADEGRTQGSEPKREEAHQKTKERAIAHIDARIRILQDTQACVRQTTDNDGLLACHAQERKRTKELRDKDRQALQVPASAGKP